MPETWISADPTGVTDSTAAIQSALNSGPGNYRLDAGRYKISNIIIPPGVRLQGVEGATLVCPPTGSLTGNPRVLCYGQLALIKFFEQDGTHPTKSSFLISVHSSGTGLTFVRDVWLGCCAQGVYVADEPTYVSHVFGSPLWCGLRANDNGDVVVYDDIHWVPAGVPDASFQALVNFLQTNLIAFDFLRNDALLASNLFCYLGKIGYRFRPRPLDNTGATGVFTNCSCDSCITSVDMDTPNTTWGVAFNGCLFAAAAGPAVRLHSGSIRFTDTIIEASSIPGGVIMQSGGELQVVGCRFVGMNVAPTVAAVVSTGGTNLVPPSSWVDGGILI